MLTVGILTYNSPITLYNTLLSYEVSGLLNYTDDIICIIQPSPHSLEEKKICETFRINKIIMNNENTKMAGAIDLIQTEAKYEYVLFLECDFRICVNKDKLYELLNFSIFLIQQGIDFVRLRSLKNPGHQIQHNLYKNIFDHNVVNNSFDIQRQLYLILHYIDNPHEMFPDYILKINQTPLTYLMSSQNAVYTNNPHIISKTFYQKNIKHHIVYGDTLESIIDMTWHEFNFKICATSGCFTHMRMDGHINCDCCPISCGGQQNTCKWLCCDNQMKEPNIFKESDLLS
jgi:hypothetical protein